MTKKLDFGQKWQKIAKILFNSQDHTQPDVKIMFGLDFTPTSWKVWKPKLIEMANVQETDIVEKDDEGMKIFRCKITYEKKTQSWHLDIVKTFDKGKKD